MSGISIFHAFFQTNQGTLIKTLNAYFEHHGLSLKLNVDGICNGLCSLRTKYILKKEEKTFNKMIEAIGKMRKNEALPEDLHQFIIELFLTAEPNEFDKKLNQSTSMEAIPFTQKPLKAALNVSMVTSELNWVNVIRDIALQEGEALLVGNISHIVSISKQGKQYHLYDPNLGFHIIDTEEELMHALNRDVFLTSYYTKEALGLNIRLMQHPITPPRQITLTTYDLYDKYLSQDINKSITRKSKNKKSTEQFNSLEFALTKQPDVADIQKLLDMGCLPKKGMLTSAITNKASPKVCKLILSVLLNKNLLELSVNYLRDTVLCFIIFSGVKETLDNFLRIPYIHQVFLDALKEKQTYSNYIKAALFSGNGEMLNLIFSLSKAGGGAENHQTFLRGMAEDKNSLLSKTINSSSSMCVRLILDELHQINYKMTPAQHQAYLLEAIQSNNFHMVRQFIEITPRDQIKTIHLRLSLVEKTNLPVLNLLQQSGIEFSNNAKAILSQKEYHWVNILRWIACVLEKIKDYFLDKPLLSSKKDVFFKSDATATNPTSNPVKANPSL